MKRIRQLIVALVAAASVLGAAEGYGGASAARASAGVEDRSAWPRICVGIQEGWVVGKQYVANDREHANCRVFPNGIEKDVRPRRFVVSVPQAALDRERVPVVFMFHGTNGSGEKYWDLSRWRELADLFGFVAVFPSSLGYDLIEDGADSRLKEKWNGLGQECNVVDPSLLADDVQFVRAIVDDLRANLGVEVDERRVYAAGFSNGSTFVHRLAHEAGDVFAAAAGWAGGPADLCAASPRLLPSADPIPFWAGIGSKDHNFAPYVDLTGRPQAEVPLDPLGIEGHPLLDLWFATASSLYSVTPRMSGTTTVKELACAVEPLSVCRPGLPGIWSPVLTFDPLPGTTGDRYLFVVLDEAGHHYPNAWPRRDGASVVSQGVTMAALHLKFFLDNPKPA